MKRYHVAVIGSGLGGSACALVLAKLGYDVLLLERGSHPRFAIGESATPVMSKKIRFLGKKYGIPEFDELSTYDKIKQAGNTILCGPKELFQYYIHEKGQTDYAPEGEAPEVIVQTPEVDAQYYRAQSDEYMVKLAQNYGVHYMDRTSVSHLEFASSGVTVSCERDGVNFDVEAEFIIDGTGFRSIIGEKYDLKIQGDELKTPLKSRSIFTHFKDVGDFEEQLLASPGFQDRSPAPRARATQHHCFEGGWLWIIPFENGATSVGLNLDMDRFPMNDKDAEEEFWEIVNEYPIIRQLLSGHENSMPFIKTGRLQFINREMVGDRWAMLPAAAYGLDAWFSTGLAMSFMAIHRLVDLLTQKVFPTGNFRRELLVDYEKSLMREYYHVSKMIHGIYKSFRHFDVFRHYCFLCFMGAESYMAKGGIEQGMDMSHLLLSAGDPGFIEKFNAIYDKVIQFSSEQAVPQSEIQALSDFIRFDMKEYNFRNFGDPGMHSMHPRVAMSC
ncbi:MAG: hypothetical protein CMK89_08980 [Pseudomonadales bacterium]|nr:hypothetical protein [Pseudomonadales bacterium]